MIEPPSIANESERLEELKGYDILDTPPEKEFDDVVKLASKVCEMPISLVSLIDKDRQWFKANKGLEATQTSRDISFCGHAIGQDNLIFEINDTRKDDRFYDNPLVKGNPNIRFYAGAVLTSPNGYGLGTLCVIDDKPRVLTDIQKETLVVLANLVAQLIHARQIKKGLELSITTLEKSNNSLVNFANIVAHDLRSPLNNITISNSMLASEDVIVNDPYLKDLTSKIEKNTKEQNDLIENILSQARNEQVSIKNIKKFTFSQAIDELRETYNDDNINWTIIGGDEQLVTDFNAFKRVLDNLSSNAIKYCDKTLKTISFECVKLSSGYKITVKDNGVGICKEEQPFIFDMLTTVSNQSNISQKSTGIGLHIVKSIVLKLGGEISVQSDLGLGTSFTFTLKNLTSLYKSLP